MTDSTVLTNWIDGGLEKKGETGDFISTDLTQKRPVDQWREFLSPEIFEIVPDLWLQFPPPTKEAHQVLGAVYTLIMVPGVLGNLLLICLVFSTKALRRPSNILVVNLAISDFLMMTEMPVFIYNSFYQKPSFGVWGCQLYGFIGGLTGTTAIMTIAAMAGERYYSISRLLDPRWKMTRLRGTVIAICIWIYSLTFSVMPVFRINQYVPEGYLSGCSFDYIASDLKSRIFVLVFFIAAWCFPVVIICLSYSGIIFIVCKKQFIYRNQEREINFNRFNIQKHKKTEIKLAKLVFALISFWMISWTPYAVVALLGISFNQQLLTPTISVVPALFCKTASVLDPFLYGLSHPRFKAALREKFSYLQNTGKNTNRKRLFNIHRSQTATLESRESFDHRLSRINRYHEESSETRFQCIPLTVIHPEIDHPQ
ncbi:opsin, ultraviolet-sensitive-like [Tachypleus tridentatus]|uniref:opsin, ultraviolet-sensitive-like n=1 Tax=Tachypleus tridentatus TaxID=6853 RepID=UPI003FD19B97